MAYKDKEDQKKWDRQHYKEHREECIERAEKWRKDNLKRRNEYSKQWREDNPEKVKKYSKTYCKKHRERAKRVHLKRNYDLSYENWLKMWENQDGRCAICGKRFVEPSDAYVDHNHETNEIRSLLCRKCNFGLGMFNDDPELTTKATEYLEVYRKL